MPSGLSSAKFQATERGSAFLSLTLPARLVTRGTLSRRHPVGELEIILVRYLLHRFFRGAERLLLTVLPTGRFRNAVMKVFYTVLYAVPLGTEAVTYHDGTKARFRRFLLMPYAIPNQGQDVPKYLERYQLKPGDYVLDAGAWPGDFAVYAAMKVGPGGKVICFEVDPYNTKVLESNLRLNNLSNVIIVAKGLWSHGDDLDIEIAGKRSGIEPPQVSDSATVRVHVTTADDELAALGIDRLDFVKMDIEGAEVEAIKGFRRLMRDHAPQFAVASYHRLSDGSRAYSYLGPLFEESHYHSETVDRKITYAEPATAT